MCWKEWFQHKYMTLFSQKSAQMALLQNCANAHAAEIATELGIDVHSLHISYETEEATSKSAIKNEQRVKAGSRVVAYIEAPNANDEQLEVLEKRIRKECPVARSISQSLEFRRK